VSQLLCYIELPFHRDVSGVELLMNNHQSLRAEIDARDESFTICINLGKDILARGHYRYVPYWDLRPTVGQCE